MMKMLTLDEKATVFAVSLKSQCFNSYGELFRLPLNFYNLIVIFIMFIHGFHRPDKNKSLHRFPKCEKQKLKWANARISVMFLLCSLILWRLMNHVLIQGSLWYIVLKKISSRKKKLLQKIVCNRSFLNYNQKNELIPWKFMLNTMSYPFCCTFKKFG